jgi:hypothetical protein
MKWTWIMCAVVIAASAAFAETKFSEARSVLDKWVETRQLLSREKAEWDVDKAALQQQAALMQKELELISEQIAKVEATSTQADKERKQLVEDRAQLEKASVTIHDSVVEMERRVVELAKSFPAPLMERIEPLFKRIPKNPATTSVGLGERMQNVIGILSEVDKFNGNITVVPELRKSPAGDDVQVKTIYLGLGSAFFVDKAEKFAGVGVPGPDGWKWEPRNELAGKVARSIYIYENAAAAVFVELPVTISQ